MDAEMCADGASDPAEGVAEALRRKKQRAGFVATFANLSNTTLGAGIPPARPPVIMQCTPLPLPPHDLALVLPRPCPGADRMHAAGILSFPFAFGRGGYVGTTAFVLIMSVVSLTSSMALARGCAFFKCDTQAALARATLGPAAEVRHCLCPARAFHCLRGEDTAFAVRRPQLFVNIAVILFGFGACTGYLLVIGDYMSEVAEIALRPAADPAAAAAAGPG